MVPAGVCVLWLHAACDAKGFCGLHVTITQHSAKDTLQQITLSSDNLLDTYNLMNFGHCLAVIKCQILLEGFL